MKFSLAAAATLLSGVAFAQQAAVINDCKIPIYVQSYPYDGSAPGPLTEVQPGKEFTEKYRAGGSTIKIGTTKALGYPLFFGYSMTSSPNYSYYEFSTQFGNPFAEDHNTLSPGAGCQEFNCAAGDASCYSTPSMKKVYGCPSPVDLTATMCA